jgi:hypothetical protein
LTAVAIRRKTLLQMKGVVSRSWAAGRKRSNRVEHELVELHARSVFMLSVTR